MTRKRLLPILIVAILSVTTVALTAEHLSLRLPTLSSGGGRVTTDGAVLIGSIGQPIVGQLAGGGDQICSGLLGCATSEPQLAVADVAVQEGDTDTTTAVFTVTLSAGTSQTVTVQYASADGTATAGDDYLSASGVLTLAPGLTEATIPVTILGDTFVEGDETFEVTLSNPTNAELAKSQGIGTIVDDEGVPSLRVLDTAVAEGDMGTTTATFTVTLSYATVDIVTVKYATTDGTATAGSDYLAATGTLTLTPGLTEAYIPATVYGDRAIEGNEAFTLTLSSPANAILVRGAGAATILDDDADAGGDTRVYLPLVQRQ